MKRISINLLDVTAKKKKLIEDDERKQLLLGSQNLNINALDEYYKYINKDTLHLPRISFKLIDVVNNTNNDFHNLYTLNSVYKDYVRDIKYDGIDNRDLFSKIIKVFITKVLNEMFKGYEFNTPAGRFAIILAKLPQHRRYSDFGATYKLRKETGDANAVVQLTNFDYNTVKWYSNYMKNGFMYRLYVHNDCKTMLKTAKDIILKFVTKTK